MTDRFYGKTWIARVQFSILGGLGVFGLFMGIGFWTGTFKDANEQTRPDAGPPLTIISSVFCLVAGMAFCRLIFLRKPVIRLYKEGVEVMVAGGPGLGSPLGGRIIGLINVVWAIVSLRGFKSMVIRFPWDTVSQLQVQGMLGYRWLLIGGLAIRPAGGAPKVLALKLYDAYFLQNLDLVAQTIITAKGDVVLAEHLPSWSEHNA